MLEPEDDKLTHEEAQRALIEIISKSKRIRPIEQYQLERKAARDWLRTISNKKE